MASRANEPHQNAHEAERRRLEHKDWCRSVTEERTGAALQEDSEGTRVIMVPTELVQELSPSTEQDVPDVEDIPDMESERRRTSSKDADLSQTRLFSWRGLICLLALVVITVAVTLGVVLTRDSTSPTTPQVTLPVARSIQSTVELQATVDRFLEGLDTSEYGPSIGEWNVSLIEDFSELFSFYRRAKAVHFNEDISGWDTSSAKNMSSMFRGELSDVVNFHRFNQDLSSWNVSGVTNMNYMFSYAFTFNQPLSTWQVSAVTDMNHMFHRAVAFNQDLSTWDVSSVNFMQRMFNSASSFNGNLSTWDVSKVKKMWSMFSVAPEFNRDISSWDVSNVITMWWMSRTAKRFNSDLSSWNVSSNTNTAGMFWEAESFNQDLSSWDVSNLQEVHTMFHGAKAFRQNLCEWGDLLPKTIELTNIFRDTSCEYESEPDLNAVPPGPFGFPCL